MVTALPTRSIGIALSLDAAFPVASDEFFFGAGDWGTVDGIDTPDIFGPSADAASPFAGSEPDGLPVAGHFGLG